MLMGLSLSLAMLLGAILVVTGPTVIGPLLRHVRPRGKVASIVKWEGILCDPIGAVLAVLVLKVILLGAGTTKGAAVGIVIWGVLKTVVAGTVLGVAGGMLLLALLRRHWIPDFLQSVFSLAMVLALFTLSNFVQHEAGLLTVTVMGMVLVNQKRVPIKHIIEFKEHLRVLLISCLFIVLAARMTPQKLAVVSADSLAFLAALILVVRPAAVFLSTLGSGLSWQEKVFISWMAPRGIVAAAMASLFSMELIERGGMPDAAVLEPLMFVVIVGTVAVYGLTARPVAHVLKLVQAGPQGLLLVGAHEVGPPDRAGGQGRGVSRAAGGHQPA